MSALVTSSAPPATSYAMAARSATAVELRHKKSVHGRLCPGDPVVIAQAMPDIGSLPPAGEPSDLSGWSMDDFLTAKLKKRHSGSPDSIEAGRNRPQVSAFPVPVEYRTYYDVFRIRVEEPCDYQIKVEPKCNCIGFTKTIVLPMVCVLDSSGAVLSRGSATPSWGSPALKLTGHFPDPGEYLVLVGADNSVPGMTVGNVDIRTGGGTTFVGNRPVYNPGFTISSPLESTPEGAYKIEYRIVQQVANRKKS